MNRFYLPVFLLVLFAASASAQDTLPRFSVKNVGNNRFIIGWVNNYPLVKQISIQRSHDSLSGYTTILSVTDPNTKENGYADVRSPNDHMFYRLFVVLDKGEFLFTKPRKPSVDTARGTRSGGIVRTIDSLSRGRDSTGGIKPIVPKKPDFIPSFYVYTNRDGYVFINLPDADKKKYHLKFYEEDDSFLFEIKSIREPALTLDKTNFMHAGWFRFELYNDDKLIEKNKIYLSKEF